MIFANYFKDLNFISHFIAYSYMYISGKGLAITSVRLVTSDLDLPAHRDGS